MKSTRLHRWIHVLPTHRTNGKPLWMWLIKIFMRMSHASRYSSKYQYGCYSELGIQTNDIYNRKYFYYFQDHGIMPYAEVLLTTDEIMLNLQIRTKLYLYVFGNICKIFSSQLFAIFIHCIQYILIRISNWFQLTSNSRTIVYRL